MTTKTKAEPKFANRVRFNWGFHDAALAVRCEWDNADRNFGFAKGFLDNIQGASDVLAKHPDSSYARGWFYGYHEAKEGKMCDSSEPAWNDALSAGQVEV